MPLQTVSKTLQKNFSSNQKKNFSG